MLLSGLLFVIIVQHATAGMCNYGIKEYSVLSDYFTAGFAFVDSYCQNLVTESDGNFNFEFKCNNTGNRTYVGVIANYGPNGMFEGTSEKDHS